MSENATVTGTASATTYYVYIGDSSGTFSPGAASIAQNGDGSYTASFNTATNLTVGTHSGALQIQICGDQACQSVLGQSSLPFTITVQADAPPTLSSLSPDPLVASAIPGSPVQIAVTLHGYADSDVFGSFQDSGSTFEGGQPVKLTATDSVGSAYKTSLNLVNGLVEGPHTGTLSVQICGDSACQSVYASASLPYRIQKMTIMAGQIGTPGSADGPTSSALFNFPQNLALDRNGDLYVTDAALAYSGSVPNASIRKITPSGTVSTLASLNPAGNSVGGVGADSSANVYVTDSSNGNILKITPTGQQSVLATMGNGATMPGLTVDQAGNIDVVCDCSVQGIQVISPTGMKGSYLQDPPSQVADAYEVVADAAGNFYITHPRSYEIHQITPSGTHTTLAGSGTAGSQDGTGTAAQFNGPHGIAIDAAGNLYVADVGNGIRMITPAAQVSTIMGPLRKV